MFKDLKFLSILLLKLFLLFGFNSNYNKELFYDFVNTFDFTNNPWNSYFYSHRHLDAFPYHALMLYILKPLQWISILFEDKILSLFLFKLHIIFFDILLLYALSNIYKLKEYLVFWLYFANPVVLYSSYILGQLDLIPMSLLLLSLVHLKRKQLIFSALIFGFALATKLNILVALPLIFLYIKKKESMLVALKWFFISIIVVFILDSPFIFSKGFYTMVLNNPKHSVVFDTKLLVGGYSLYPTLLVLVFIYFHFYGNKKINFDLLFTFLGILFSALVFFVSPVPSWFLWFIPFIVIYFADNIKQNYVLYIALMMFYICFFFLSPRSVYESIYFFNYKLDFFFLDTKKSSVFFTLLETSILIVLYGFYKFGINSNRFYNNQLNFIIGVAGDSGAGKTMFTNQLNNLFKSNILHLEGDGEHKWERGDKNWETLTHLDPRANNIHQQASYIYDLKNNKSIQRSDYDHSSGTFSAPIKIKPKEYIALSGLHPFYLPKMRKTIDLKIFLDTDETLRNFWKIKRDTQKRGYSIENILEQIEFRKEDAVKYIKPQMKFSDLIFNYFPLEEIDYANLTSNPAIGLKVYFDANLHLDKFISMFSVDHLWDYSDDLKYQYICFETEPQFNFRKIAEDLIPNLYEIIPENSNWLNGYQGLSQLFVLLLVSEKRKNYNGSL